MAKNLQVNLTFSADTSAAKAQLQQLQQTLSNLAATPITGGKTKQMQADIAKATESALQLKIALQNATNVDTGKLNFTKFSQQLKQNKMTLQDYAMQLKSLGPAGAQAFSQLAQSIRQSETPLIQLQGKAAALGKTLANTARWMMSSALLQGVTRAFTGTIDYAKELNESLNNIRIVTNKSEESMSKFAKQANEAAKALSTTTTKYTDASLIYYQQGLGDQEVLKRAETTLKLANVVGEEASTVSEWMTAIWNNFDDGSQQLEFYADVLAKLGAATASSADEIAGGLEKFAAVADTVGLSYEYAASALATITAETRQSEDVVGTALKTIFARIENLKLGDTLEDGTSLGQYSAALAKVGVNIKDANGNLRDMDGILDDIGKQWELLNKDEQVALAQSVAGIRQYNQFIALMDNWDVMEKNVELAKDATGELEYQQEIYEQGIEGATARVKANLEDIKNNLLDENDLVPLLNGAEDLLGFFAELIDSLGGLPGILSIIAAVGLKIWGPQAATALTNMVSGVQMLYSGLSGQAQQEKTSMSIEASNIAADMAANTGSGEAGIIGSSILKKEAELTALIENNEKNISADKKQQIDFERQMLVLVEKRVQALAEEHDQYQKNADSARRKLETLDVDNEDVDALETAAKNTTQLNARAKGFTSMELSPGGTYEDAMAIRSEGDALADSIIKTGPGAASAEEIEAVEKARKKLHTATNQYTAQIKKLDSAEKDLADMDAKLTEEEKKSNKTYQKKKKTVADIKTKMEGYREAVSSAQKDLSASVTRTNQYGKVLTGLKEKYEDAGDVLEQFGDNTRETTQASMELEQGTEELNNQFERTEGTVRRSAQEGQGWASTFVSGMQGVASTAAGIQMITGSFENLTSSLADGTANFSTYLSALTSLGFALPMLASGLGTITKALRLNVLWETLAAVATKKLTYEDTKAAAEEEKNAGKSFKASLMKIGGKIGEWISKGPVGWAIAAVSAALLAAVIGTTLAVKGKQAKITEEETAETANAKVEEKKEEVDKNGELFDSYHELLKTYQETGEGREELAKTAQELALAYGIEGAALAALSGNYDALTESINAARIAELKELAKNTDTAIAAGGTGFEDAMRKDKGHKAGDGYKANFNDGGGSGDGDSTVVSIAKQLANENPDIEEILDFTAAGSGDIQLKLDDRDPESFAKGYEAIEAITTEARARGVGSKSELYSEMMAWLSKSKEQYDKYAANNKIKIETEAEIDVLESVSASGKKVGDITNLSDYLSYRNNVLGGHDKDSEEYKARLVSLGEQGNTKDLEQIALAIEEQATSIGTDNAKEWLTRAYETSSQVRIKAMAMVTGASGMTEKEFFAEVDKKMIEAAEAYRDAIAGEYEIPIETAETYANALRSTNIELADNEALLQQVAGASIKLNQEVEKASKIWKDNSEALLNANQGTFEYAEALSNVATSLETMFGLDTEKFDLTYLVHHNKELVTQFFNGNLEVFDVLQQKIATTTANTYSTVAGLDEFITTLFAKEYKVGESVDTTAFANSIQEIAKSGALGITAIQAVAEAAGFALEAALDDNGNLIINKLERLLDGSSLSEWAEDQKEALAKSLKSLDEEIERYHLINEQMENLDKKLDVLSKKKDRAFGKDKLAYMQAENKVLEEQISLQEQLVSEMQEDLITDQAELNKWGFSTDNEGNITNYEEVYKKQVDAYNAAVKSGNENEAKELWKDFEDALKQYKETRDDLEDAQIDLINYRYDYEEKRLEDIQTVVEDNIEMAADKLSELEYIMSKIEDSAFSSAEAIKLLSKQASIEIGNLETYTNGLMDVLKETFSEDEIAKLMAGDMSVLEGKELTSDQVEAMREMRDDSWSTAQNIRDYANSIKEEVVNNFEEHNEQLERQTSLLEHNHSIMSSYKNIVDLVGADNLGIDNELLSQFNQQAVDNAKSTLEANRVIREANKIAADDAKKAFEEGAITEEQYNTIYDAYLESEQAFMDSWNSALEAAGEAFDNEVQRILDTFDKALGGLEEKLDWFDKLQTRNEIFYKDYEKTYQISKLNRQINDTIDSTDNIQATQKLSNIQKQLLAYRDEGAEMSKYDLEYLQKQYDLEVARIALEEARNAKSIVRLRRDSEGNFGYTYTADANEVGKAEQTYEDKKYEMEKFLDESSVAIQQQIMDWNQQMMEELGALDKSAEDYDEKASRIVTHYSNLINSISDEGAEILQRGKEMNEEYGTHAAETFNETIMGKLYTDIESYKEFNDLTQQAISQTLSDLEDNHSTYQSNVDGIFDTAGSDVEDFKNEVVGYLGKVNDANKEILTTTGNMATQMGDDFGDVVDKAIAFQRQYNSTLQPIITKSEEVASSINKVLEAYAKLSGVKIPDVSSEGNNPNLGSNGSGDKSVGGDGGGSGSGDNWVGFTRVQTLNGIQYGVKDGKYYELTGLNKREGTGTRFNVTTGQDEQLYEYNLDMAGKGKTIEEIQTIRTYSPSNSDQPRQSGIYVGQTFSTADLDGNQETYGSEDSPGDPTWNVNWDQKAETFKFKIIGFSGNYTRVKPTEISGFYNTNNKQKDALTAPWIYTPRFLELLNNKLAENKASYRYAKFDTGGYTGAWGPEGRIAMLHQKEIVLNAHDTENFLTAIGIVRDISDQIEKNAIAMQYQNQFAAYRGNINTSGDTLQQEVHITAEFPNATNHSEIEEAFRNLTNLASQYANRK